MIQYIGRVQRSEYSPVIYDSKVEYLRNILNNGISILESLRSGINNKFDELILAFEGSQFYVSSSETLSAIDCLELQISVEEFKPDVAWQVREVDYISAGSIKTNFSLAFILQYFSQ